MFCNLRVFQTEIFLQRIGTGINFIISRLSSWNSSSFVLELQILYFVFKMVFKRYGFYNCHYIVRYVFHYLSLSVGWLVVDNTVTCLELCLKITQSGLVGLIHPVTILLQEALYILNHFKDRLLMFLDVLVQGLEEEMRGENVMAR